MGVLDLGLDSDVFWKLTFAQIFELYERKRVQMYVGRFDIVSLRVSVHNMFCKEQISVADLLGPKPETRADREKPPATATDLRQAFKALFPVKPTGAVN